MIDRERLILNIFHSRATTKEAKLQIELAEIKYEMPRVRENAKLTSGILKDLGREAWENTQLMLNSET